MNLLRNRFLGTAAFLSMADGDGGTQQQQDDPGKDGGAKGADDVTGKDAGQDGDDDGAAGGDQGDDDGAGDGDDDGAGDGDEDPLAGLSEEQRKKIEARMAREVEKETRWRDRQIGRLQRQRTEAREDNRALETIANGQRGSQPSPGAKKVFTEDDVQRQAQIINAQDRYDEGCTNTDAAGRGYFGTEGWNKATNKLKQLGGVSVEDMMSILNTDHPAMVIQGLSADPDEYERIMALPPAKRNTAFVKLGLVEPPKKGKAEPESKRPGGQPPPPRGLSGGSRQVAAQTTNLYDDKLDDDKWYEERNKNRRKKFSSAS